VSTLTYTFAAGETKRYASGKFFKVRSASFEVEVVFFKNNGSEIGRANFSQGDSVNIEHGYAYAEVTSNQGQIIEVHTLNFIMESSSVVGDVNALVRDANLTIDGDQFFCGDSSQANINGYSSVALINESGSLNQVFVDSLKIWAIGSDVNLSLIDDFDTDGGAYIAILQRPASNKDLKGVDSVSTKVGRDNLSAARQGGVLNSNRVKANSNGTPTEFDFRNSPFELSPNQALVITSTALNSEVVALFEFSEKKT